MTAQPPTSTINKRGFTLLEVMFAMVILMIGLLGFMQGVNVAAHHNMQNLLRQEAAAIAEQQMNTMKLTDYVALADRTYADGETLVYGTIRGGPKAPYILRRAVTTMANPATGTSSKELKVQVSWVFKTETQNYELSSIRAQ